MKKKKIFLIEDNKNLVEIYTDKFTKSGFKINSAFSVAEAIDKIKKDRFDLILLDIRMPEEDGIMFLKKASEIIVIASTPIIAFSNYDTPEIKGRAKKLGANKHIIKSNHTPGEVINLIKDYLK